MASALAVAACKRALLTQQSLAAHPVGTARASPANVPSGPNHQHIHLVSRLGPVSLLGSNTCAAAGVHAHMVTAANACWRVLLAAQLHDWAAAAACCCGCCCSGRLCRVAGEGNTALSQHAAACRSLQEYQ